MWTNGALVATSHRVRKVSEERLERAVERRFRVDTLESNYEDWVATPATSQAVAWLAAEEGTLLGAARKR